MASRSKGPGRSRAASATMTTLALAAALWGLGCPARTPHPGGEARRPARGEGSLTLELRADPGRIDRVELVGELCAEPRAMDQVEPGLWRIRVDGLAPGRWYRYAFGVHRSDSGAYTWVSDPKAWLLDASLQRWSLARVGGPGIEPPPPPRGATPGQRPSLRDLVIYELNPREFVDPKTPHARPAADPGARGPGQVFRRITEKIRSGYFEALGVSALELMPVMASAWTDWKRPRPERDPWGYSPLSWYAINGDYGSPADLRELIAAAHQRGLLVLLDYSLDHGHGSGKRFGLITDLFPDWRVERPKNPWGLLELDLERPELRRFLVGALRRLLLDYRFDGLRLDWTELVPPKTWAYFVEKVRKMRPEVLLISENPVPALVREAGFAGTWDFFFHWEAPLLLRGVWTNWDGINKQTVNTQQKLVENLTTWARSPWAPPPPLVRYIESHDTPRIARPRVRMQAGGNQLLDVDGDGKTPDWLEGGGPARSRLGATLLATVPGAVLIFAGQEHGAADDLTWTYDPIGWQAADPETLAHYQKVLTLRGKRPELRGDDLRVLINEPERHLLVYSRGSDPKRTDDDTAVAAFNFGPEPLENVTITLPTPGCWHEALSQKDLPPGAKQTLTLQKDQAALMFKIPCP